MTIAIFLFSLPSFLPCTAECGTYSGGSGEPNDPFIIAAAEDLNDIANHPNDFDKHFLLVNGIDLSAYTAAQFNIIGYLETLI